MSERKSFTPTSFDALRSECAGILIDHSAQLFLEAYDLGLADSTTSWRDPKVIRRSGSRIDGVGIFATGIIEPNSLVAVKTGHVVDEKTVRDNAVVINHSQQQIEQDKYITGLTADEVDRNLVGYNHSCDPNAEVILIKGVNLAFIRSTSPINEGDEITVDYSLSMTSDTQKVDDCKCGSENCRKIIDPSHDWLNEEFQKTHLSEFAWYMRVQIEPKA